MPPARVTPEQYDAVLFDLDGVLTATAKVHAAAWKRTFDQFLQRRAGGSREGFTPFDIGSDYERYVDGRLRQDGVRTFLTSRDIQLPEGEPGDSPDLDTVHP
jgi:beta-phosphoglucomutase-like phosphatase (HAD superfamily)